MRPTSSSFGLPSHNPFASHPIPTNSRSPVYGVIFLFKYPVGQRKSDDGKAADGTFVPEAAENLFFANQVIQNACATQAILSVLLNRSDIDVGKDLRDFREFTQAFPSDVSL